MLGGQCLLVSAKVSDLHYGKQQFSSALVFYLLTGEPDFDTTDI